MTDETAGIGVVAVDGCRHAAVVYLGSSRARDEGNESCRVHATGDAAFNAEVLDSGSVNFEEGCSSSVAARGVDKLAAEAMFVAVVVAAEGFVAVYLAGDADDFLDFDVGGLLEVHVLEKFGLVHSAEDAVDGVPVGCALDEIGVGLGALPYPGGSINDVLCRGVVAGETIGF